MYILNSRFEFEWDPLKAQTNAKKHGVSFREAVTAFLDASALEGPDMLHSSAEARFLRVGSSTEGRVLTVAYTVRRSVNGQTIRIISARQASRRERSAYTAQN